jgi:uncharacterized protein
VLKSVDVFELARTGGHVEGSTPAGDLSRLSAELVDPSGQIAYRFEGRTDSLGRPAVRLRVAGRLPVRCDRCGEPVVVPLDRTTEFFFVRDEAELAALPVTVEDEPEPLLGSPQFDLAALVEDEAILSIPLSPRHDTCPGNKPDADRSGGATAAKPFAVLPGLLHRDGS